MTDHNPISVTIDGDQLYANAQLLGVVSINGGENITLDNSGSIINVVQDPSFTSLTVNGDASFNGNTEFLGDISANTATFNTNTNIGDIIIRKHGSNYTGLGVRSNYSNDDSSYNILLSNSNGDNSIQLKASGGGILYLNGSDTGSNTIASNGCLGIGTSSPMAPLDVRKSTTQNTVINWTQGTNYNHDGQIQVNNTSGNVTQSISAIFEGKLVVPYLWVSVGQSYSSDERIKTNINDISDGESLNILRLITPKTYNYIDATRRGNKRVYGFIAQDIQQYLPHAVTQAKTEIPNIYMKATVVQDTLVFTNTLPDLEVDSSGNIYSELSTYELTTNTNNIVQIIERIDDYTLKFDGDIGTLNNNECWCFGQIIDNFLTIDKNSLYTTAFCATQELDRQQTADKLRIAELESQVSTQNTQIADLLARVTALESV
jgi:hypothetical protein